MGKIPNFDDHIFQVGGEKPPPRWKLVEILGVLVMPCWLESYEGVCYMKQPMKPFVRAIKLELLRQIFVAVVA